MTKVEFEKWVDEMLTEYRKTAKRFTIAVDDYTGTTLCGDDKTGKCAMARCHPNDNYNYSYGKAIAYARCRGYEIPKLTTYKKLSEMEYGDKFKFDIGFGCYMTYTFIAKSTLYDQYIIEEEELTGGVIKPPRLLYLTYDNEEYEMVE